MKKLLSILMLLLYFSVFASPYICKAVDESCAKVEPKESQKNSAENDLEIKEIMRLHPIHSQQFSLILGVIQLTKKNINTCLSMQMQDKNSPIFSPPPQFFESLEMSH